MKGGFFRIEPGGDFEKIIHSEIKGAERAVTRGLRQAGEGLKSAWRNQITAAGLGERLGRTIRHDAYPKGGKESINAASLVYSRASKLIDAFDRGVTIRSKKGFWLAIPTPAAGTGLRGKKITPGEWERRHGIQLRFVYRRGMPSLLVADKARVNSKGKAVRSRSKTGRGQVTSIIFLLVPQVTLRKRLDLAKAAREWEAKIPSLIIQNWPEATSDKA